jgi:predicted nucleic acid-binding protein
MTGEFPERGLLDTNIVILRKWISADELPAEVAISAITLAELSAGPHEVRRNEEQDDDDEHAERARRLDVLQRAESEFDPIPFGADLRSRDGRGDRRRT